MLAMFFLAIGALCFWMVFRAFASGELKGRGWGFSYRIYRRDREPFLYWLTFSCWVVCALGATVFGVLAALKSLR